MTRNLLNKKKKGGFTLIELIIVIAIIAILAAVALPKFAEIRENANVKADISNAKNIQSEVNSLIGENRIASSTYTLQDGSYGATTTEAGLQNIPLTKASANGATKNLNYSIYVSSTGDVVVSAGSKVVYPNGATPYNN